MPPAALHIMGMEVYKEQQVDFRVTAHLFPETRYREALQAVLSSTLPLSSSCSPKARGISILHVPNPNNCRVALVSICLLLIFPSSVLTTAGLGRLVIQSHFETCERSWLQPHILFPLGKTFRLKNFQLAVSEKDDGASISH